VVSPFDGTVAFIFYLVVRNKMTSVKWRCKQILNAIKISISVHWLMQYLHLCL